MSCRRPAYSVALAAALVLAARPAPVRASEIASQNVASYQLVNTNPTGTTPVTKIVANVVPAGSVTPPDPATSPLTIMPGSSGFDQTNLQVLLGSGQTPDGSALQALALDFGTAGFQPGGVLNFSLSLSTAFQGIPTLQLPDGSTGLSVVHVADPVMTPQDPNGGAQPPGGGDAVPEPASLAVWSSAALGLVVVIARQRRRLRRLRS